MSLQMLHVRLKPYDPSKGHLKRNYTAPWGSKFKAGVWYEVDPQAAAYLKSIRQHSNDQWSKPAFDVCTKLEAEELVAREEAEELGRVVPESNFLGEPIAPMKATVRTVDSLNRPKPKHELSAESAARARARAAEEAEDILAVPPRRPRPVKKVAARKKKKAPAKKTPAKKKKTSRSRRR